MPLTCQQVWERVAAPIRNMFVTFAFSGKGRLGTPCRNAQHACRSGCIGARPVLRQ